MKSLSEDVWKFLEEADLPTKEVSMKKHTKLYRVAICFSDNKDIIKNSILPKCYNVFSGIDDVNFYDRYDYDYYIDEPGDRTFDCSVPERVYFRISFVTNLLQCDTGAG